MTAGPILVAVLFPHHHRRQDCLSEELPVPEHTGPLENGGAAPPCCSNHLTPPSSPANPHFAHGVVYMSSRFPHVLLLVSIAHRHLACLCVGHVQCYLCGLGGSYILPTSPFRRKGEPVNLQSTRGYRRVIVTSLNVTRWHFSTEHPWRSSR